MRSPSGTATHTVTVSACVDAGMPNHARRRLRVPGPAVPRIAGLRAGGDLRRPRRPGAGVRWYNPPRNPMTDNVVSFALVLALVALVVFTFVKGVRIVAQGEEWVVERLGKYHATLRPGLSVIIPFLDNVAYKVVTKDIVMDIPKQEVITKDNAVIHTNAIAFIKVVDPPASVYGVEDFMMGTGNLVQTSLRSIIGRMELDEALSSREQIKVELGDSLRDEFKDWGIVLKSVEIQDIKPSESMQTAMEQQAASERQRKALVIQAEGEKAAAILQAEGRLESAKRDAEAEVTLANASKQAIELVQHTTEHKDEALSYLLGQRYIEALQHMAQSQSGRFVLLPADLQAAVKGLLAAKK